MQYQLNSNNILHRNRKKNNKIHIEPQTISDSQKSNSEAGETQC